LLTAVKPPNRFTKPSTTSTTGPFCLSGIAYL
jgi:hypothetical protein